MKLRSITLFPNPNLNRAAVAAFPQAARTACATPVRTVYPTPPPFSDQREWPSPPATVADWAAWRGEAGADCVSPGPVLHHPRTWLDGLPAMLDAGRNGRLAPARRHHLDAISHQVSAIQPDGQGNLHLTLRGTGRRAG